MSLGEHYEVGLLGVIRKRTNSDFTKKGKIPSKDQGNPKKKSGIFLQITRANPV